MNKIEEYGLKLGGIYIEKNTEENEEIELFNNCSV